MRSVPSRIATPAFAISVVIIIGLVWILTADIVCTAKASGGSILEACESKPLAYEIFPNPILYFLELTDLARILQLLLLAAADLLVIAMLFRLRVLQNPSWLAAALGVVLFLIASEIFAFLVVALYLHV